MTTPSNWSLTGLNINTDVPLAMVNPFGLGITYPEISEYVRDYSHEKSMGYGDKSCEITLQMPRAEANDWLENGITRSIWVSDQAGRPVWSGFVNSIKVNAGFLTLIRGPITDVGNLVHVDFTEIIDDTVYPPIKGMATETLATTDAISVSMYGRIEKVLSGGTCTRTDAGTIQGTYLLENAYPKSSSEISISPGDAQYPTVTLECLGFVYGLMMYLYESTAITVQTISAKIAAIIAARPVTNYLYASHIATNAYLVGANELNDRFAYDIIKGLVALGDINYNPYDFGVDSYLNFYYRQVPFAPADLKYILEMSPNQQTVKDYLSKEPIYPWSILPGYYLQVTDFGIQESYITSLRDDPRSRLIENVKYTAPWSLDISGGKTDRLSSMLAQITMSGGLN